MPLRPPTARGLRAALVLVPVAPLLALAGLGGNPAQADPAPYVPADGPHYVTADFGYTGAPDSFIVPAGVTSLEVSAYGASGGSATPNDGSGLTALGGRGSVVSTVLDVVPGTVYSVNVGGRGGDNGDGGGAAGWNGGGAGGGASRVGAGGGGATDLRSCAPEDSGCDSLASRILVAAGGGGAGFGYDNVIPGADADAAGGGYAGSRGAVDGGQPGTATAGGAGGAASDGFDRISRGGDGMLGSGGVGGGRTGPDYVPTVQENAGAGGGGGGLYGGGGGGDNRYYGAAGGGGSTLAPPGGGQGLAEPDTDGFLQLTYDLGPITSVGVTLGSVELPASGTATTVVTVSPRTSGSTGLPGLHVTLSSTDPGQSLGPVTDLGDGDYTAVLHGSTTVGTASLLATVDGDDISPSGATTVETVSYTAPAIRATLTSAKPRSGGWYRTPVRASFTCSGSRPVTCPAPTTLSANGRSQVVTRTITDDQGRSATARVTVSIDRTKPVVRVTGARNGATYTAKRKLTCKATDTLSGVASCKVTTRSRKAGRSTVVTWTGTAYDRAGNKATTTGRYTIRAR
ncbi:Ig-like domain-containing protein [Nocardioides plantarum]|nr:Ig-like domain-containing protein [Nocardioides plantarum]